MDLNTAWFLLIGVLIIGYAILDGFDFGVGFWHLFSKNDKERRINMNAIGPVWDGNEVWLITGGAALFAAFPIVYATVFSGFYLALTLVLLGLIFRAVSLEFRGKVESGSWKRFWDWSFGLGSILPALLFGVAVGNVMRGIPINAEHMWIEQFPASFLGLLNPYSLVVGILGLVMFIMHGAIYMTMKTEGELRARMSKRASSAWIGVVSLYVLITFWSFFETGFLFDGILGNPLFWILFIVFLGSIVFIPLSLKAEKYFRAFLGSSLTIGTLIGLAALSMFPRLVTSSVDSGFSLTIYNAASSDRTLTVMLIITLIGMPIVIAYSIYLYRVFKGTTVITEESY